LIETPDCKRIKRDMPEKDALRRFLEARAALRDEYEALRKRLSEVEAALRKDPLGRYAGHVTRAQNTMTMREAITRAVGKKPLGFTEVFHAVTALGYKFSSAKPKNSLGAYLYGPGKSYFKRVKGKFSLS
jgi:hypothetical protein